MMDCNCDIGRTWCERVSLKLIFWNQCRASGKQHNTFTTIAAANAEVIASYHGCYEWLLQLNSSVKRRMATSNSYIATPKFKVKIVAS